MILWKNTGLKKWYLNSSNKYRLYLVIVFSKNFMSMETFTSFLALFWIKKSQ